MFMIGIRYFTARSVCDMCKIYMGHTATKPDKVNIKITGIKYLILDHFNAHRN